MKIPVSTGFVVMMAALTNTADAAHGCNKNTVSGPVVRYQVRSSDKVPDIPGICGGLWDNMKRFGECASASNTWCGDVDDGYLGWDFTSFVGCSDGMVSSTWYEATRNQWGHIDCST